ncbi:MAG: aldehyde dehydrogenase, partial [Pseudomonadota bacterium]
ERSRAAGVSMIPTSTSAAGQLGKVLPDLSARLTVAALRVPAISVSAIDLVLQLSDWPTDDVKDTIGTMVRTSGVMASVDDACVSSDLRGRPESLILATRETQVLEDKQIRLFGWYDNEWGFSARMLDLARLMADRKTAP